MQKYFPNEIIGNRYGKLVAVSIEKQGKKTFIKCICDCGNSHLIFPYMLANNTVKSCGCSRADAIKKYNQSGKRSRGNYQDGKSMHPLYGTWRQMIARCENPKLIYYSRYGGRGIEVCDEWHDFWNFVKWSDSIGGRPKGYTLDRIDNDGNYEPSNCRWASLNEQSSNKSSNIFLEYNGKNQTMMQWSKEIGINFRTLNNRINRGWSIERALTEKSNH